MATSLGAELEDSLSAALEISKEVITQVASLSEDATTVLRKCNDAFDKHTSQEAKWRSDLATLRRARVNSGSNCCCFRCENVTFKWGYPWK